MNPTVEFLKILVTLMIANPTMTKAQAVDELQLKTNGVSNVQGNVWFDEIAMFYASIGTINNGNYGTWRSSIVSDGEAISQALLDATGEALMRTATLQDINMALRFKDMEDKLAQMLIDIPMLRTFRDAQTDPAIIKALTCGILDLVSRKNGLQQRIGTP